MQRDVIDGLRDNTVFTDALKIRGCRDLRAIEEYSSQ
jgi:hypothetical protein